MVASDHNISQSDKTMAMDLREKIDAYPDDTVVKDGTISDKIILPGSKDDPYRGYRISKQIVLCLIWTCIVSIRCMINPLMTYSW